MSTLQFVGHAASLSLNDLIRSADEMQNSGKVDEAANLYRQWLVSQISPAPANSASVPAPLAVS